jgi:tRNA dimethylallyltransferase
MPQNRLLRKKSKPTVIFLVGPTAIGKSALAVLLAKEINAEIISMDSMQIYKGFDIVSSKPSKVQQKKIRHHLLDIVSPSCAFDVAQYRRLAIKKIKEIQTKGKIPLFVGGTGLYMNVVVDGIFKEVKKDEALRKKLYAQIKVKGSAFLHKKLRALDSKAAAKIHPNDSRRIVRALEVYALSGKPISELWRKRKGLGDKYKVKIFALNKDRQALCSDINARVERMFRKGLVKEVERILKRKVGHTCSQAIGINEVRGYLEDKYDLTKAKELIKQHTRNYAKRQLTWFRKDKRISWVEAGKDNTLREIIAKL